MNDLTNIQNNLLSTKISNEGWPYFEKRSSAELLSLDRFYFKAQKNLSPGDDLTQIRSIRALRIPKNILGQIVAHPNYISICYYLAAKPLYVSGVIQKQANKAAYQRLAEFFQISESGMRSHLNKLESLGLVRYNSNKDIIFSGYKTFCRIFNCGDKQYKHKYYIYNDIEVKTLIKTIAYAEKQKKIEYIIFEKLCYLYLNMPDWEFNKGKTAHLSDILKQYNTEKDQKDPKAFRAKLKKAHRYVEENFQKLKDQYELIFEEQIKVRVDYKTSDTGNAFKDEREYLDPISTLSCAGMATLLNRKSKSTGYYQALKMFNLDFVNITRRWVYSDDQQTFWDIKCGDAAPGTCVNKFPKKVKKWSSERRDKYLINLSNVVKPVFNLSIC